MRMVTRTIKSVIAITKCYDFETNEVVDKTFNLGNVPANKIEKTIDKILDGSNLKFVKLIDITHEENLYKMTEQKFIENAEVVE